MTLSSARKTVIRPSAIGAIQYLLLRPDKVVRHLHVGGRGPLASGGATRGQPPATHLAPRLLRTVPLRGRGGVKEGGRKMRVESSVTSVSWIPSEAVTGAVLKGTFESGFTHYDEPPPETLDDLEELRALGRFRFAN